MKLAIGVMGSATDGVADAIESLVALCAKQTGAVVLYDADPARLVARLLVSYRTEHHVRPNCFCSAPHRDAVVTASV